MLSKTITLLWDTTYLRRAWKHTFTCIQSSTTSILDLLYFRPLLADDRPHARVGNHEFNSDRPTTGYRRHVEGFVINTTDNEAKGLDNHDVHIDWEAVE